MPSSSLLILANGAEEMEAVITIDVLRRGGVNVTVAGLDNAEAVTCSRNVVVKPDTSFDDVCNQEFDAVILPGGLGGAKCLAASEKVGVLMKKQESRDGFVACICAAPIALISHGIGKGKTVTSHPSVGQKLKEAGYTYSEDRVVTDGKLVTSRGPGTAFEFALALVEHLEGKAKRDELIPPMLVKL